MTISKRTLLAALSAAALLAGCGRTLFFTFEPPCVFDSDCPEGLRCVDQVCREFELPDGSIGPFGKRFGEPCDGGAECESGECLGGPRGDFCTRACDADAGCPLAYACKGSLPDGDGGLRGGTLCAVDQPLLCQACAGDLDCGGSGGDRCLFLDGGAFCGRDCTLTGCPELFSCDELAPGVHQCQPQGRTCDCVPETLGLKKSCRGAANPFGACLGTQTCQVDGGFTDCNAPTALQETCNGADDDCNGAIDDFAWPTCTRTANGRTCTGPQICLASAGLKCNAVEPSTEVCNLEDDDCNGVVDDGFVDGLGRYTQREHCGACNNDCQTAIAHVATSACVLDASGQPRCQALTCQAGFFPYADGGLCLQEPNTLCQACATDTDCVNPGARCIVVDGAKVCGRQCGTGSPACPSGYACSAQDGGSSQCTPVTGTCTCRTSTLGAIRSCQVTASTGTCNGFETCASAGVGPSWSACDVNSFNPEICDGRDNNCDTRVDEGFKNQTTGKYDTTAHCGFCNNDCSKIFSPALQHTNGVCDTGPAMPRCAMGPCLTEVDGGTTFEWVDVNGQTIDGCECRRVQGNGTVDLPDRAPATGNAPSWVDQNCDGVDGVVTNAIFVSATAAAGGNGTRTAPLKTITAGLSAMQAQSKRYVLVAAGLYRENVRLFDGAQLFGGYSSDFFKRDPKVHTTWLQGVAPTATAVAAIHGESLGLSNAVQETVVAGFTLVGEDVTAAPAEGANGQGSTAVYLRNCGARVVLSANDIIGGRGGRGGAGRSGGQGFGRQVTTALNGAVGRDSQFFNVGFCNAGNARAGAAAGQNAACSGANGGTGGGVVCPVYTFMGNQGQQQQYVNPPVTSRNGRGGWDWSFDTMSSFGCNHVTESGFPTTIQPHDGADGLPGPDGSGGSGGAGAAARARHGSIAAGRWVASPFAAVSGVVGGTALGGGGGGAGGGVAQFLAGGCGGWEIGATGGGGGAGACGGEGGRLGGAGGASIGLLLSFTAAPASVPTITQNRFQRGLGGNGGNGGFGGAGGLGGAGGFGGGPDRWSSSIGGKGGEGGNGGPGGGGGGGAGGPSWAVLGFNTDPAGLSANNTFLSGSGVMTGGQGGAGGSSPGPASSTGTAGVQGASADTFTLRNCGTGCPGGTTCDANMVCVPN